jgi:hypothetical protein
MSVNFGLGAFSRIIYGFLGHFKTTFALLFKCKKEIILDDLLQLKIIQTILLRLNPIKL